MEKTMDITEDTTARPEATQRHGVNRELADGMRRWNKIWEQTRPRVDAIRASIRLQRGVMPSIASRLHLPHFPTS